MPTSRQRRATQQRGLRRQLRRRYRSPVRRRRALLTTVLGALAVVVVVVVVAVTASGGSSTSRDADPTRGPASRVPSSGTSVATSPSTSSVSSPATSTSSASTRTTSCTFTRDGTASRAVSLPPSRTRAHGLVRVRLRTSQGPLVLTLRRGPAPCAVDSVVSLVEQHFYDDTPCYRLVTRGIFVVQCGDPTGTGGGGPGYSFAGEAGTASRFDAGTVVMADSGPDRVGSQFFLVYRTTDLGQYTVIGRVTSGLDTVAKVARAGTSDGSTDGPPALPLRITRATVG